jgi:hypothetical protein
VYVCMVMAHHLDEHGGVLELRVYREMVMNALLQVFP